MRPELARIEAILHQTKPQPQHHAISFDLKPLTKIKPSPASGSDNLAETSPSRAVITPPAISFPVRSPVASPTSAPVNTAPSTPATSQPHIRVQPIPTVNGESMGFATPSSPQPQPQPCPLEGDSTKLDSTNVDSTEVATETIFGKPPSLPAFKSVQSISSKQSAIAPADPTFTLNVLETIRQKVLGWQTELDYTRRRIRELYLEGPIVEGWLESYPPVGDMNKLRPDRVSQLIDYEEKIKTTQTGVVVEVPHTTKPRPGQDATLQSGYRFCTLADGGRLVTYPCPPNQVPSLSMAISRYQKLCQLIERQTALETQLQQLTETLVTLQNYLPDTVPNKM